LTKIEKLIIRGPDLMEIFKREWGKYVFKGVLQPCFQRNPAKTLTLSSWFFNLTLPRKIFVTTLKGNMLLFQFSLMRLQTCWPV
jgi:hypothetical protein